MNYPSSGYAERARLDIDFLAATIRGTHWKNEGDFCEHEMHSIKSDFENMALWEGFSMGFP
jgi:hypothetical protein